jgi:F-type H+-transporting ATPase subunit b
MLRQTLLWSLSVLLMPVVNLFAATAEHAEGGGAHAGGDNIFAGDWALPVLTLVVFIVLLVVLGKWAWGPILAGLQKREEHIRQSIEDAEQARADAEKSLAEYKEQLAQAQKEAQVIIEKGRADAGQIAEELKQKAQEEAQGLRVQAQKDISTAKDQAVKEISDFSCELAADIAGKIINRSLDAKDHRDLLNESLNKLQEQNRG